MVVYEDKTWQTNSLYPNEDFVTWEENRKYWVIPDDSELANKIRTSGRFKFILNDAGELTDIEELPIPETWKYQSQIDELKKEAERLDMQAIRALRAIAAGTATDDDKKFVTANEEKVAAIRNQIAELEAAIANEPVVEE